jgi:hypothetical protein
VFTAATDTLPAGSLALSAATWLET